MPITEAEITAAGKVWGDALVAVSKAYDEDGIDAARAVAEGALDAAYGYNLGPVLFKPTLSGGEQTFRTTRKGALSYFVGHDPDYPNDQGFGTRSWRKVVFETAAIFHEGEVAMWMGWVHFTDKDGNVTKTDKTFGYKKDEEGTLRIVLHHSSLPFQG